MDFGLSSPARRARVRRGVFTVGLVWAGAWGWFAVASAASEGLAGIAYAILFLSVPVILLVGLRRWPRVGGFAAILAALFGAFFFHHWAAWAFLCAPALLLGVASVSSAEPAVPREDLGPGAR